MPFSSLLAHASGSSYAPSRTSASPRRGLSPRKPATIAAQAEAQATQEAMLVGCRRRRQHDAAQEWMGGLLVCCRLPWPVGAEAEQRRLAATASARACVGVTHAIRAFLSTTPSPSRSFSDRYLCSGPWMATTSHQTARPPGLPRSRPRPHPLPATAATERNPPRCLGALSPPSPGHDATPTEDQPGLRRRREPRHHLFVTASSQPTTTPSATRNNTKELRQPRPRREFHLTIAASAQPRPQPASRQATVVQSAIARVATVPARAHGHNPHCLTASTPRSLRQP